MAKNTKKRTVMESLTIGELSGVDVPAMEGAKQVLLKRYDPEDAEPGDDFEKRDPSTFKMPLATGVKKGHQHLLDGSEKTGRTTHDVSAGEEFSHSHATLMMPDGSIKILMAEGHDHEVETSKSATGGGQSNPEKESTMDADTKKTADDGAVTQEQLDKAEARAERAEKVAELTDEQKSYFKGLGESEQGEFLQLDSDGRQNEVDKARADDPVVYKDLDGNEYRKSDDERVVSAVKRADAAEKRSRENEEKAQKADLTKRAGDLKFVKGEDEVKVALLKAIDGIEDEKLRKGCLEIVAQANSGLKDAFEKRGTAFADAPSGDAEAEYEKKAQEYAKTHSCTIEKARSEVLMLPENADLATELTERQPVID